MALRLRVDSQIPSISIGVLARRQGRDRFKDNFSPA